VLITVLGRPTSREQFTVALGPDFDTGSVSSRGRRCCRPTGCCPGNMTLRRCCSKPRRRRRGCCVGCTDTWDDTCCCYCRTALCKVRPSCVCTVVALVLLALVIVAIGLFLTIYLLVTRSGCDYTCSNNICQIEETRSSTTQGQKRTIKR